MGRLKSRSRKWLLFLVTLPATGLFTGCVPLAKRPFQMVQLCVVDAPGVSSFKSVMRSIAQTEGMRFVDNSDKNQQDLKSIAKVSPSTAVRTENLVDINVEGDDGIGLGAGNLGLPTYQMAIGFSEGNNPQKARAFSQRVVNKLKVNWKVETVPDGQGALPMKTCLDKPPPSQAVEPAK